MSIAYNLHRADQEVKQSGVTIKLLDPTIQLKDYIILIESVVITID